MAKNLNMANLLDFYGAMLTDKQREAMSFYYDEDLSLGEISNILGITRQGVRDHVKKGEESLSYFEKKLRLSQKFAKVRVQTEKITEVIDALLEYNRKYLFSAEVTKRMEEISALLGELVEGQVS